MKNYGKNWLSFVCVLVALACDPVAAADYDSLVQDGLAARNQGDMPRAELLLREAYPLASDKREITYLLAMVLAFQQKFIEAEQLVATGLNAYPDDTQLQLARARINAFQNRYADAEQQVFAILEDDENNLEARNLLARVLIYQGDFNNARQEYLLVLSDDAVNLEALVGLYDAESGLGNRDQADNYLRLAQQISPDHVDVLSRLNRTEESAAPNHQILWAYGVSDISRSGFSTWHDRVLEYRHFSNNGSQQFLRVEHDHRFDLHDSLLEVGMQTGVLGAFPMDLSIAWSDDAEFLPEYRIRLGTRRLINSFVPGVSLLRLGIQRAKYNSGDTTGLDLQLEHYLAGTNLWLTPGLGMLRDENGKRHTNWQFGIHNQFTSRFRAGISYIDAPETENNLTADSRTGHAYLAYQLNDGMNVRLDLVRNLRDDSYTRENYTLSFQYRFRN